MPALVLFGVPATKDAVGAEPRIPTASSRWRCAAWPTSSASDMVLIADLCLDEYTDHGHCGVLDARGEVDNDRTLDRYAEVALAQAEAGADVVAPSGMMDGQVSAIRPASTGPASTTWPYWPTPPNTPPRCTGRSVTRST